MELKPGEVCKYKDICKFNSNAYNIPCYGALENRDTKFVCEMEEFQDGNDCRTQAMDE
jgi:hypothetical protein